jgi:hypothetical protein
MDGFPFMLRLSKHSEPFLSNVLARFIVVIVLLIGEKIRLIAWNFVALFAPRAEIDKPATLGAKRPVRIIFPVNFFAARRALHRERHERPRD